MFIIFKTHKLDKCASPSFKQKYFYWSSKASIAESGVIEVSQSYSSREMQIVFGRDKKKHKMKIYRARKLKKRVARRVGTCSSLKCSACSTYTRIQCKWWPIQSSEGYLPTFLRFQLSLLPLHVRTKIFVFTSMWTPNI